MPAFITCDTDLSEIISINDVKPYLTEMRSQIVQYETDVTKTIRAEQNGGLSSNAFYINSTPLLSEKADTIISGLSIESSFNTFNDEVMSLLDKQRNLELTTLATKISEKISELNMQKASVVANIAYYMSSHLDTDLQNSYKTLRSLEESIEHYSEKLETVREAF